MIGHFESLLEARDYFFPHSRAVATRLTLRNMLTKPGWNHLEVRTMRGVLWRWSVIPIAGADWATAPLCTKQFGS